MARERTFGCGYVLIVVIGPREMLRGGRWEGGSCLGTHVRIKDFKIKKKIIKKKEIMQFGFIIVSVKCVYQYAVCKSDIILIIINYALLCKKKKKENKYV